MRTKRKLALQVCALAAVVALVGAACGGDDDDSTAATGDGTSTTGDVEVPTGGQLVIGAEQEPECVAWIRSCAGSSWGYWMMGATTMPRVFDTEKNDDGIWEPVAGTLVTEEPTVDDSDPAKPVITYNLNPDAVWSDNTPITCDDFAFTWDAVANGPDIYDPTGYVDVEKVDCPEATQAVVTFSKPYAAWKELFGGGYGVLPKHLLEGKDILAEMGAGYDWSGGPWKIQKWEKGVEVILVPNENFWGDKPKLETIVFKVQADTSAEFQAFNNGETDMIYPQPQPDVVDQIADGLEGAQNAYTDETGNLEALWMNNAEPPLDDLNVRQALGYAIDRDQLVERLFGGLDVTEAMQTLNPTILAKFADTEAWADYQLDLDKVDELLTDSGYEKNGEFYEKNGERLTLQLKTTAGNARRALTADILQELFRDAGIELTISLQDADALFGDQLPKGDFQIGLYAQVLTFVKPGQCNIFCAQNIPGPANDNSGQNWTRTDVPELTEILAEIDTTVDEDKISELGKQADKLQAENMVSLPLDPLPNILIWADKVVGPISDNPVLGPFVNSNLWGVTG